MKSPDISALAKAGLEALQKGEFATARDRLSAVAAAHPADVAVWLALSRAHAGLEDATGERAALDKVLERQPNHVRAVLWMGDLLVRTGQERAASGYYQAALRLAPSMRDAPRDLIEDLARAKQVCERYAKAYEDILVAGVEAAGYRPGRSSARFGQALEIMFGRKQIYMQAPRFFYFPGLPHIQFFERDQFSWLDGVEAATNDIRNELLKVLQDDGAFTPYVEGEANLPRNNQMGMLNNPNWGAFYLLKNGSKVEDHIARCPKTFAALGDVPMPTVTQRCPSVLYSLLRPRTRIPPHNGLINTRLICHLPLIVPEGCGFRVGNETRQWREGKAWVFDDTIEHEAWNDSDRLRVILIFEIWRPDLTEEERTLVSAMFRTIDSHTGETPAWEI